MKKHQVILTQFVVLPILAIQILQANVSIRFQLSKLKNVKIMESPQQGLSSEPLQKFCPNFLRSKAKKFNLKDSHLNHDDVP